MTEARYRICKLVLLAILVVGSLYMGWQFTQNGRYIRFDQGTGQDGSPQVIDTRTGTVRTVSRESAPPNRSQQVAAAEEAARNLVVQGNAYYDKHDLQHAADAFEQAMKLGPNTLAGQIARTNLAVTDNVMGVRAFEHWDISSAEMYFNRGLGLNPSDPKVVEDLHYNLGKLHDRIGNRDRATDEWQRAQPANAVRISDR